MSEGLIFYRCTLCARVVSPWDLRIHQGCPKCQCPRIKPANLNWLEKCVQIVKHPNVWAWNG